MAILPTDGRVALAKHLADAPVHFAWGTGAAWWDSPQRAELSLDETGRALLPFAPVLAATVTNAATGAAYNAGADYVITNGGELIRMPQGAIPADVALIVEYTTGRPGLTGAERGLTAEIGRRRANTVGFVTPDDAGDIETPGQRWSRSDVPTRHLHLAVHFGFGDASDATIREIGIFTDTVTADGVPPDQLYLTPDEIAEPGILLLVDRLKPIFRSPAETRSFAYVVTI